MTCRAAKIVCGFVDACQLVGGIGRVQGFGGEGSSWTPKVCKTIAQNHQKTAQRAIILHTLGVQDVALSLLQPVWSGVQCFGVAGLRVRVS